MSKKLSKKNVESSILSVADINTDDDFVALTVELDDNNKCKHSGILICYNSEIQYFHYDSKKVELTKILPPEKFYFKETNVVHEDIVDSFLWHCEKLSKEVSPIYGWHFDGSYYDSKGSYYLKNATHDITTCVGFCIKVLTGFEEDKYLEIEDWDSDTLRSLDDIKDGLLQEYLNYLNKLSVKLNISVQELFDKDKMKRILPSEMFSSAFYNNLPIRKAHTDEIVGIIESYFKTIAA